MTVNNLTASTFIYDNIIVTVKCSGHVTMQSPTVFLPRHSVRIHRKFTLFDNPLKLFSGQQGEFFQFMQDCSGSTEGYVRKMLALGYLLTQRRHMLPPLGFICVNNPDNDTTFAVATGKSLFCHAITEMSMGQMVYFAGNLIQDGKLWGIYPFNSPIIGDLVTPSVLPVLATYVEKGMRFANKGSYVVAMGKSESPRMIISTNLEWSEISEYPGVSDRFIPLFFDDFFSEEYTPIDRFHHLLFDNWDEEEWCRFDNLMIFCISAYHRFASSCGKRIFTNPSPVIDYLLSGIQ